MQHIKIYLFIFSIASICFAQCGTTDKTVNSMPSVESSAPRQQSHVEIWKEIKQLEKDLTTTPHDHEKRLRLAAKYQEVREQEKTLEHLEFLAAAGYTAEPRLYGSLALIYKDQNQFEKARKSYLQFEKLLPADDQRQPKIKEEIADLDHIINVLNHPDDIILQPMPAHINSGNSEYLPQFTLDEEKVIFTRRYLGQEDLMTGTLKDSIYMVSEIKELNTSKNEGAHAFSADGQTLIFTKCDKRVTYGSCDLFRSTLQEDGTWSKPTNMGERINSREWDSQPSLSADGKTLYFASKRFGGLGGSDIYKSTLGDGDRWSRPVNLGKKINTRGSDESPFIHADGETLYFRSTGHQGIGRFDLFFTKVNQNNHPVTHLGSPINTTGEDGALIVSLDGRQGYYATDVYQGKQQKHLDLFEFELPEKYRPIPMTFIKGRVIEADTDLPVVSQISIRKKDDLRILGTYKTTKNGELLVAIPVDQAILYDIQAEGYIFSSNEILITEVSSGSRPQDVQFVIHKISAIAETHAPIVLHNIFFESGSATLLASSDPEIDNLVQLMSERPSMTIEIIGHTDDVGSIEDNQVLSLQRATAVRESLVTKGISDFRIRAIGKGESQPIISDTSEEARKLNRRVEFIILTQ